MRHNPASDVIDLLLQRAWTTAVFWLLNLVSLVTEVYLLVTIPRQRRGIHLCD